MTKQQERTKQKLSIWQKCLTFFGVGSLLIFVLAFIFAIYLFGIAGMFRLLDIHYPSVWSLIIFVASFLLIVTIFELFVDALTQIFLDIITDKFAAFIVAFIPRMLVNGFCLFLVDMFMTTITLTLQAGLIIAAIMSLLEITFENQEKTKET